MSHNVPLRTAYERFANLKDYPFQPNYVHIQSYLPDIIQPLRMHYVDECTNSNYTETILLLHGEPSWSYLYRHMIPVLVKQGYRVVAPDLIGFGKSDKLPVKSQYTYQNHINWMTQFIEQVDLKNITLFCQDWGSLIGLATAGTERCHHRFIRFVLANGGLPTGEQQPTDAFIRWQKFAAKQTQMDVGSLIQGATVRKMNKMEIDAYNAPYPSKEYQAGALQFPVLVPTPWNKFPANNTAWDRYKKSQKPFLTCFSDSDPVTKNGQYIFQKEVPGCKAHGVEHTIIKDAGHFCQEDKPQEYAEQIIKLIKNTPQQHTSKL